MTMGVTDCLDDVAIALINNEVFHINRNLDLCEILDVEHP